MKRILEPEVMDTIEEARAYDDMDFLEVNTAFVNRLIDLGISDGHFLDLGTGTARIPWCSPIVTAPRAGALPVFP